MDSTAGSVTTFSDFSHVSRRTIEIAKRSADALVGGGVADLPIPAERGLRLAREVSLASELASANDTAILTRNPIPRMA